MSDKPISVGDMVVVVKPSECCGDTRNIGWIFRVDNMMGGANYCGICKKDWGESLDLWPNGSRWSVPIQNVKRIPPLSELEGERREEEIPA
jgi:hypothetical protein